MTHHRRTRAQQRADEIDISPTKLLADIEQLRSELEATRAQADDYLAGLQRERAEFLNFKRRTAEEREASLGLAAEGLISKVLTLADDFDLAIEARPEHLAEDSWVEGVTAIDRKLRLLLESEGVRPIPAAPGTPFIPASTRRSPTCPRPDSPRAPSSRRSAAVTGCANESSDRHSSPWPSGRPAAPPGRPIHRPPLRHTDRPNRSNHAHGQDHRHRPRHDEQRRRRHGGRRTDRHRLGRGRPDARRSSPSPRAGSVWSASSPSARRSPTPTTRSTRSSASWVAATIEVAQPRAACPTRSRRHQERRHQGRAG